MMQRLPGCMLTALAVALTSLPPALAAQTIKGVVLEGSTSNPVIGATVEMLRADSTAVGTVTSDEQGWFELDVPSGGTYLLRPSHPSYVAAGLDSVPVGEHEIVSVVLRMGAAAIPIERLVVTARSGDRLAAFYRRAESEGFAYFLEREEIEKRRAALPTRLVQMMPGIRIAYDPDGRSDLIMMRGIRGQCPATVLLDGLPVAQDIGMSIDEFTSPELLEGVEIYPPNVALPQELPVIQNDCGVVAFWSRREAFRPLTWTRVIVAGVLGLLILLGSRL